MHSNPSLAGLIAAFLFPAIVLAHVSRNSAGNTNPGVVYKVGGEVTAPRALYDPLPEYSERARRSKHQGTCILSLVVDAEGKPTDIRMVHKAGFGLDDQALDAIRTWTFEPARRNGLPVSVQIQVQVDFRLYGKSASPIMRAKMEALVERIADDPAPRSCGQSPAGDNLLPALVAPQLPPIGDGTPYRLERIAFSNNHSFTNVQALRVQFPIKDGDAYDRALISKGLENLRSVYAALGYLNFAALLIPHCDQANHTVSLEVITQEGKQFFISRIAIVGLDPSVFKRVRKELFEKSGGATPGEVYNQQVVDLFLKRHAKLLPKGLSTAPGLSVQKNEQNATVALTYDFRPCQAN
jgi:TonB family protein